MFRPTVIRRTALYPLLSIALVLPSAAAGADLHVSAAGDGSCTVASQGCTLTAALGAAQPGDRIVVHGGVYRVSGQVSDGAGGVSIVAAPNEPRPVLDLSAGTLWLTHDTDVSGIDLSTTNGTALVVAGGTLDRVRIGVTGAGATGVNLGSGATLRNSTVIATGSGATGIHASGAPLRSTILGSTLLAAGAGAAAVSVSPDAPATSATLRAVNTIFSGTNGALDLRVASDASSSATAVLHHSATSPTRQSVIGAGASIDQTDGTITADPHFVDRSSGDLRQAADSPTIDAGTADVNGDGVVDATDTALIGPFDVGGDPRELGTPDVGADEHELPPVIVSSSVVFDGSDASLKLSVQPNGQSTSVAADWSLDSGTFAPTSATTVTGNAPTTVSLPLGTMPASARKLTARLHATSKVGVAASNELSVAVPVSAVIGSIVSPALPPVSSAPATTPSTPSSIVLPGSRPKLIATSASQRSAQFAFRLLCNRTTSCRGSAILSRVGGVRSVAFKIPPGQIRTVKFNLTATQRERVKLRGRHGLRGLLELRSLDEGSSWTAVRLYPNRGN